MMEANRDPSVIPSIADKVANEASMAAIDKLIAATKYVHVIAWGKWLGFTPETVQRHVVEAEAENAPLDAIQKIDGKWQTLDDIASDLNRERVKHLANAKSLRGRGR